MKRKFSENKLNSIIKRNGSNEKLGYVSDSRLLFRVRQQLESDSSRAVSEIVDDLQKQYPEYQRKKRNAFTIAIQKIYDRISPDFYCDLGTQSTDSEEVVELNYNIPKKINLMNTQMSSLYKGEAASSICSLGSLDRINSQVDITTDIGDIDEPRPTFTIGDEKTEQDLGYVIDKTPMDISIIESTIEQHIITIEDDGNDKHSTDDNTKQPKTIEKRKQKSKQKKSTEDKTEVVSKVGKVEMSEVKFSDVGGYEASLLEICKLLVHMKHPEVYSRLGVQPPRGFLLHGPPGCGKTLVAHAVAGELEIPMIKVAATEIVSGVSGESEEKLRQLFETASMNAPCILFIDEIDSITQKRENASKDMERRIVAQLLTCMDDLNSKASSNEGHVLVIGATNRPDSLDAALRRAGRFDREISLGIPDERARERILRVLCKGLCLSDDFDFTTLAHVCPGYVGADLASLAREAAIIAVDRVFNNIKELRTEELNSTVSTDDALQVKDATKDETEDSDCLNSSARKVDAQAHELETVLSWLKDTPPLTNEQLTSLYITYKDFIIALTKVQPSAKREGFATVPDVTWDDIGALKDIRNDLELAILAPVKHREEFLALGMKTAPGVLLAGPPGCGKTLLAKAIANESGINFISVKGPELLNMYVGESERAVRQVFQRARNSAPCVIFFDELDALCPRRSHGSDGGSTVRVVNQLLTEMDGLEERKQVFIMAATNRPDIIDPAILRPGRLDKILYVGLPSENDRNDILNTLTKNGTKPKLDNDVILIDIAVRCNNFTGADLAALVREASVLALSEYMEKRKNGDIDRKAFVTPLVSLQHFDRALLVVKPSVSEKDQKIFQSMKERVQR